MNLQSKGNVTNFCPDIISGAISRRSKTTLDNPLPGTVEPSCALQSASTLPPSPDAFDVSPRSPLNHSLPSRIWEKAMPSTSDLNSRLRSSMGVDAALRQISGCASAPASNLRQSSSSSINVRLNQKGGSDHSAQPSKGHNRKVRGAIHPAISPQLGHGRLEFHIPRPSELPVNVAPPMPRPQHPGPFQPEMLIDPAPILAPLKGPLIVAQQWINSCYSPGTILSDIVGYAYAIVLPSLTAAATYATLRSHLPARDKYCITSTILVGASVGLYNQAQCRSRIVSGVIHIINTTLGGSLDNDLMYPLPEFIQSPPHFFKVSYLDFFNYRTKFEGDVYPEVADTLICSEVSKSFGSDPARRVLLQDVVELCKKYDGAVDIMTVSNTANLIIERISICQKSCALHSPDLCSRVPVMPWR